MTSALLASFLESQQFQKQQGAHLHGYVPSTGVLCPAGSRLQIVPGKDNSVFGVSSLLQRGCK